MATNRPMCYMRRIKFGYKFLSIMNDVFDKTLIRNDFTPA